MINSKLRAEASDKEE